MPFEPTRSSSRADALSIEAKLRAAFELSPTILAITTAGEGRLLEVNEAFTEMHGYAREEVIGRTVSELDLWIDPEQRRAALATIGAGRPVRNLEARLRTKGGGERVCLLNADLVEIDGRSCILSALTDITDRVRAEQALRESEQRKDEFLAMLGHELRNPLGTITTAIALLDTSSRSERDRQVIGVVRRQTEQLTRLVDDLLDIARLTSGKIRLQPEPVDLHAVARRCIEALAAGGRGTEHHVTLEGGPAWCDGDAARLEQVAGNLLDNALKYTPAGGQVVVRTGVEAGEAVLRVRDSGKGIAPALLPRVFDFFVQEPQALDRARGGLGLGLGVVKHLVDLHGGSVSAQSAGAGQGSEFTVRLKAVAPPATADASAGSGLPAPGARRRVLVVEDNADAREMLVTLLELNGHNVEACADGPGALAALASFQPDVALIDVGLPGMDGYALARLAREQPRGREVRLVAVTGYGQAHDRQRALEAGFDRHVTKPVDPEALERLVGELP
jgi:PAS domain S-box-containing protein